MRSAAKKPSPSKPSKAAPAAAKPGKVTLGRQTLTSLAAVELQCVAQFLPLRSILAFARCNRRLFEAMQSPFAFKFAECWVRSVALPPDTEVSLNSALVRHAPLCLRVTRSSRQPLDPSVCNVMPTPVYRLQTAACGAKPDEWLAFITHPIMQSLRVLDLNPDDCMRVSQELMLAIIALQRLHTLAMGPDRESADTVFSMLPLAPALTSLTTRSFPTEAAQPHLAPVTRCPLLTSLSVKCPSLSGDLFRDFFTSAPFCSQLRSLTLDSGQDPAVSPGHYAIVFEALTALTELKLKQIPVLNPILAALSKASALTSLSLEFSCWSDIPPSALPTTSVLAALLRALPALRILCRFVRFRGLFDDPDAAIEGDELNSVMQRYMRAQELLPFASRITVQCVCEQGY